MLPKGRVEEVIAQLKALGRDNLIKRPETLDREAPVSYTHLDVYKRQAVTCLYSSGFSVAIVRHSMVFTSSVPASRSVLFRSSTRFRCVYETGSVHLNFQFFA